jgi:class 3 adenylate cyclase
VIPNEHCKCLHPAVFVSSTVRDLLRGSERKFESCGEHMLKGVEGSWHLYEMVR